MMRAKMRVVNVKKHGNAEEVEFMAVTPNEGYPEDGTDENNTYALWTPSAELNMYITNPNLFGKIEINQEFYLDFTKA